ncbi:hypothetical protein HF521_015017 [Silurus meridionalis]|uniref:Uncharacterized protein n=1 Tax=Silurus meridionalis TaxID=175797 RepID=A0A8T0A6M8_SILME|nr:hypothetical protein HF521_015017 [Silurus meridionalis]
MEEEVKECERWEEEEEEEECERWEEEVEVVKECERWEEEEECERWEEEEKSEIWEEEEEVKECERMEEEVKECEMGGGGGGGVIIILEACWKLSQYTNDKVQITSLYKKDFKNFICMRILLFRNCSIVTDIIFFYNYSNLKADQAGSATEDAVGEAGYMPGSGLTWILRLRGVKINQDLAMLEDRRNATDGFGRLAPTLAFHFHVPAMLKHPPGVVSKETSIQFLV